MQKGIVQGIAAPCAGLIGASGQVTVTASRDGHEVASEVVKARSRWRYRLSLSPGTYRISVTRSIHRAATVTVRAGKKVVVSFPNTCD